MVRFYCRLSHVFRFVSIDACLRLQSTAACFAAVERNACFLLFQQQRIWLLSTVGRVPCAADSSGFSRCLPLNVGRVLRRTTCIAVVNSNASPGMCLSLHV
ncbi:hypothetical protein NP493_1397g00000 [Ridgeia piscesae]|uniref:Uncharacterized protein n=1 Tax=Ridgeia piscesae TaxID=27915 RepID=A0AAD9K4R0_RIDPI|nr:hypothetical protein NP493_1397g00000 [Ridgeia piscesae]